MRRPTRMAPARQPKAEKPQARPVSRRDRLAILLGLVTYVCLGLAFLFSSGTEFLMPGALSSAHGALDNCSSCHTNSGTGKLSWIHGIVAGDPLADSKACLTCHKMSNTALFPHGASPDVLKRSTDKLAKVAAVTSTPVSAGVQKIAFPADNVIAGGLYCATCHQEHKGVNFDLSKISNEQCRTCHVVKFDSFDGNHPQFENYPFKRRTRLIYDHSEHFVKHFPEVEKNNPTRGIPATCSFCHNSRVDRRIMAVSPFDQTCSGCHLDQITGKERASGPKGVAFLTLPGIDVQTLKEKNTGIGEWPQTSEAPLSPFMKVMIGRNERGRTLLRTLDGVDLQDLSKASDAQVKAVASLTWEIKGIFYALISGRASDVMADVNFGGGKLSPALIADLTASIPRDVVIDAHQEWLPNLATEMANRPPETADAKQEGWGAVITESKLSVTVSPEEFFGPQAREPGPGLTPKAEGEEPAAARPVRVAQAASDQTDDLLYPDGGAPAPAGGAAPPPAAAAPSPAARPAQPEAAPAPAPAAPRAPAASAQPDPGASAVAARPPAASGDQTDDLLFPDGGAPAVADRPAPAPAAAEAPAADTPAPAADARAPANAAEIAPPAPGAPAVAIESSVDPESWAEYGGWYRQDFAIFYRPTGHKDKFLYSWLFLTGPKAPRGDKTPTTAVFDYLISKDAQGSCTKCHSVDDVDGKGRLVNFAPPKVETKQGQFTNFIHEPHFGMLENRGCLSCHNLEKGRPYLKSYEQRNPRNFVSNFGAVKKELCQTCHTTNSASQDCLLCHKYHVNGVVTPIMNTKLPTQ